MDDASRIPTADTTPFARWPVLARLIDVSPDLSAPYSTKKTTSIGGTNYRFDPPQTADAKVQPAIQNPSSEIRTGAKTIRRHQPHVFERGRAADRKSWLQRRESPILPHSNPFSIPGAKLSDSIAPVVRFLTMVALFTAAGTWIQMTGRRASPAIESMEPPRTAAQPTIVPSKDTVDRPVSAPTAAGPLETTPQSGARVGRANGDDYSSHNKSTTATHLADRPAALPPHFLVAGSDGLPQVQTSDEQPTAVGPAGNGVSGGIEPSRAGNSAGTTKSDETPTVALHPGFLIEIPTR